MHTMLKRMLLSFSLIGFCAHAQAPVKPVIDNNLTGVWEGEFPPSKDVNCTAYKWRMQRLPDGTYHFHAYDETQTILNDDGQWWVDPANNMYFETVNGQADEPTVYHYTINQSNINDLKVVAEYTQAKKLPDSECSQTFNFSESKTS